MFKLQTAQGPTLPEETLATDAFDMGLARRARAEDPIVQLQIEEKRDWALLRVLACAALATLARALATMLA
jgi:hypothetical protein